MYKAFIEPDLKVGGGKRRRSVLLLPNDRVLLRLLAARLVLCMRPAASTGLSPPSIQATTGPPLPPLAPQAAHLRIYNTFNPFSGFMSPTYILKSASPVSKEAVVAVLKVRAGLYRCCLLFETLSTLHVVLFRRKRGGGAQGARRAGAVSVLFAVRHTVGSQHCVVSKKTRRRCSRCTGCGPQAKRLRKAGQAG